MNLREWADGIETRNYGINRKTETGILMELLYIIVVFALVAGAFLYYSWIRSHIINTGYEIQDLFAQEESLLRTQKALILEEETLRNPQRLDTVARDLLGMAPLRPNQLMPPGLGNVRQGPSDEMAMADAEAMGLEKAAPSIGMPEIRTIRRSEKE
jgi:cell division protein FtsL